MNHTTSRFNRDLCGGVLLAAIGVAVAVHSTSYTVGTLSRMGPGYFPLALGVILAVLGAVIAASGLVSQAAASRPAHPPEWEAWLFIGLSLIAFVVLAQHFGLAVGTFAIVFISALADRDNSWKTAAVLAATMVVVSIVVFWWALQIQIPLLKWS